MRGCSSTEEGVFARKSTAVIYMIYIALWSIDLACLQGLLEEQSTPIGDKLLCFFRL